MAVPKRKTSKSKNKMRQAGKGLVRKQNIFVGKDGKYSMSHRTVVLFRERPTKDAKKSEKAEG